MLNNLIKANLLIALLALTACSSTTDSNNQQAIADTNENITAADDNSNALSDAEQRRIARYEGYRCDRIARTGSRIKTKTCSTKADREAAELAAKELLDQGRRSTRMIEDVSFLRQ
ncbi:hypothetical protein [Shewanella waksmanii]|nr:hypothetical protein [Shewanella waksmanii]